MALSASDSMEKSTDLIQNDTAKIQLKNGLWNIKKYRYFSFNGKIKTIGPYANNLKKVMKGNDSAMHYLELYRTESKLHFRKMWFWMALGMPAFIVATKGIEKGNDWMFLIGGAIFLPMGFTMEYHMIRFCTKSKRQRKNLEIAVKEYNRLKF